MSFNGFVFNFINDLKVTINVRGGRKGHRPSTGYTARGFVAVGMAACLILILAGLVLAGATAGVENSHPALNGVSTALFGAGFLPGIVLVIVYGLIGGGKNQR